LPAWRQQIRRLAGDVTDRRLDYGGLGTADALPAAE
jgi:hypothetical protein